MCRVTCVFDNPDNVHSNSPISTYNAHPDSYRYIGAYESADSDEYLTCTSKLHISSHLRGYGRPDDLIFDTQGRLLFSDETDGLIGRVNANGTVTVLLRDAAGPEGLVVRPDGTIIFAEQEKRPTALSRLLPVHQPPSCYAPYQLSPVP